MLGVCSWPVADLEVLIPDGAWGAWHQDGAPVQPRTGEVGPGISRIGPQPVHSRGVTDEGSIDAHCGISGSTSVAGTGSCRCCRRRRGATDTRGRWRRGCCRDTSGASCGSSARAVSNVPSSSGVIAALETFAEHGSWSARHSPGPLTSPLTHPVHRGIAVGEEASNITRIARDSTVAGLGQGSGDRQKSGHNKQT